MDLADKHKSCGSNRAPARNLVQSYTVFRFKKKKI